MDQDIAVNIVTFHSEIAPVVSNYDLLTKASPLGRAIKLLIDPSVKPEGLLSNFSSQSEVVVPIEKAGKLLELRISPNLGIHRNHRSNYPGHCRCMPAWPAEHP